MAQNNNELVVLLFDDVDKAEKALAELQGLADYKALKIIDAAVLRRDGDGKATLKETKDFSGKKGAVVGAVGGALVTVLMGPVGWVAGAVAGAGIGGIGAHFGDRGLPNKKLEELKKQIGPNSSALIIETEHKWAGSVKDALETKPIAASGWEIGVTQPPEVAASSVEDAPSPAT